MTLYSTAGCHLCEMAHGLLESIFERPGEKLGGSLQILDIADDSELIERFGVKIPVIRAEPSGLEIAWPFTSEELTTFIESNR